MRVLIVGTYRDTDLQRGDPLAEMLADFRRVERVERVSLHGLTTDDVVDFFEWTSGQKQGRRGRDLARVVRDETEGNPFFIGEVLRHLAETGVLYEQDGRWSDRRSPPIVIGLPEGVREVVGRRLGRLSPEANELLRIASVIGREFDLDVLAPASGLSEEDVLAGARSARCRAGSWTRCRSIGGASPMRWCGRRCTTSSAPAVACDLHRSGRRRSSRSGDPMTCSALARHFGEAAVAGTTEQAVRYALAAGDRSLAQLANDEAVTFYASALDLLEPMPTSDGPSVLARLGDAQRRAGDPAYRETLLAAAELAHAAGDTASEVAAVLGDEPRLLQRRRPGRRGADRPRCSAALESVGPQRQRRASEPPRDALGAELLFSDELGGAHSVLIREAVAMARRRGRRQGAGPRANIFTAMQADVFDLQGMLALGREALSSRSGIDDPALAAMAASGLHVLACRAGDRDRS